MASPPKFRRNWPAHLHPSNLAIGAAALCIAFSCFPPTLYSNLIGEPDYMFADPLTILYIVLCALGFCVGCRWVAGGARDNWRSARIGQLASSHAGDSWTPVAFAIVAALIGIGTAIEFIGNPSLFVAALATGSAESLRGDAVSGGVDSGFSILSILPLGFPLLLWAIVWSLRCAPARKRTRGFITACAVIYGVCLLLTLQRNLLLPYLISIFGVVSAIKLHTSGMPMRKLAKGIVIAGVAIIALFTLVAYFRGGDSDSPLTVLTGYLPASVNRLAALLHGAYKPAISGEPYYAFRFLWHPPLVRRFVPIDVWGRSLGLHIPETSIDGWAAEFDAISSGGLNASFIWSTALGYVFYDFGWASPLYFAALGAVMGWMWKLFLRRSPAGMVLYPYFATCILLWPTDHLAALPQIWLFVFTAAFLKFRYAGSNPARPLARAEPSIPRP